MTKLEKKKESEITQKDHDIQNSISGELNSLKHVTIKSVCKIAEKLKYMRYIKDIRVYEESIAVRECVVLCYESSKCPGHIFLFHIGVK